MLGNLGLHIIRYPSGRYGFVGRVPAVLAYDGQHAGDLATAASSGPRIARLIAEGEGRTLNVLSWGSEADARAAAEVAGFSVSGGE